MNNFEEWLNDEIASVAWYSLPHFMKRVEGTDRNGLLHLGREENIRELAHAIRNKVLHEAIEALPEERHTPHTAVHPDLRGHHIGHNECLQKVKSSLLNLLTKE